MFRLTPFSCRTDAGMISKYLIPALENDLKLFSFSFYLSWTLHFKIVWSLSPRTPSLVLLTGCLLTPSQFFQTKTWSWWNGEAILQMPRTREFLSFPPNLKRRIGSPSNLLCVNGSEAFSWHSLPAGWGKKPTDLLSLLDFSLGLILTKEHFSTNSFSQTRTQTRIFWWLLLILK